MSRPPWTLLCGVLVHLLLATTDASTSSSPRNGSYLCDYGLCSIGRSLSRSVPNPRKVTFTHGILQIEDTIVSINYNVLPEINNVGLNNITQLEIYALESIQIDTDLHLNTPYMTRVVLISPVWNVHGTRSFFLNGVNGHAKSAANDGTENSRDGMNGAIGYPGIGGANFFGIANRINNGALLTINSNGGVGGPGQNGGNGYNGTDGGHPQNIHSIVRSRNRKTWDMEGKVEAANCSWSIYSSSGYYGFDRRYNITPHDQGTKGGDAGAGGEGGKGGQPGIISVYSLLERDSTQKRSEIGHKGENGVHGKPAIGGLLPGYELLYCYYVWPILTLNYDCIVLQNNRVRSARHDTGTIPSTFGMECVKCTPQPKLLYNVFDDQAFIQHYVLFALKSSSNLNWPEQEAFLKTILENLGLVNTYNITNLFAELNAVGEQQKPIAANRLLAYYENSLKLIDKMSTRYSSAEDKLALNMSKASVESICRRLKSASEKVFITDLKLYIESTKTYINDFKNLKKSQVSAKIMNSYDNTIMSSISEISMFIETFIGEEFKTIFDGINSGIGNLISETEALKDDIKKQQKELEKQAAKIKKQALLGKILAPIKVLGAAVTVFGGPFAPIGAALTVGTKITEGVVNRGKRSTANSDVANANLAIKNIDDFNSESNTEKQDIEILKTVVQTLRREVPQMSDGLQKSVQRVETEIIQYERSRSQSSTDWLELAVELNTTLTDIVEPIRNTTLGNNTIGMLGFVSKISPVVQTLVGAFQAYGGSNPSLNGVMDQMRANDAKLAQLDILIQNIYNTITPTIMKMRTGLVEYKNSLENKSPAALSVSNWQVTSCIRQMKELMSQVSAGFQAELEFTKMFNRLEELSNMLTSMYDRIQKYQEHLAFATFTYNLFSADNDPIAASGPYAYDINKFEATIRMNIIVEKCFNVFNAFKQMEFPFAEQNLVGKEVYFNFDNLADLTTSAINLIMEIEAVSNEIRSSVISGRDQYILNTVFSSEYVSTKPFFVWYASNYSYEIDNLLSGNEVAIISDIYDPTVTKNAVKFSMIQLKIRSVTGSDKKSQLTKDLNNFHITMTHMGDSIYKCDKKHFVIQTDSISLLYSYESKVDGSPLTINTVYNKTLNGEISLSPYGGWRMQLHSASGIGFDILDKYKGKVNLELEGKGQYVSSTSSVCSTALDQYYDVYN